MSALGSSVLGGFERELEFLPEEESSLPLFSSRRDREELASCWDAIGDFVPVDDSPVW